MKRSVALLFSVLLLQSAFLCGAQNDTNVFDGGKALHFWAVMQGTRAVRVGGFGDSVADPNYGGKIAGFVPSLRSILGAESGGINSNFPYLFYSTNGIGDYTGADEHWWYNHHHLTNGSVVSFLSARPNGPAIKSSCVWCDTVAAYYVLEPDAGSFTIDISTNGGPFGTVIAINASGELAGAATNLSLPLDYYNMRIVCTNGTVTLIDGGMWLEHQPNVVLTGSAAPGMTYNDWTSVPTNITWPIFQAWKPDLLLLEAKDSADLFRDSFPLLEQMFTNCAPNMDAIYIGTTPQATNEYPTINQEWAIPQNAVMADMAVQYDRPYWDSFSIISYEQATDLGWTRGDGTHFNLAGGTALGAMLWSDLWSGLHRMDAGLVQNRICLSWYALLGRSYQVQFTPSLSPADWQNLAGPVVATNYAMASFDPLITANARYYRILLLP
jgi:hypothetical protein